MIRCCVCSTVACHACSVREFTSLCYILICLPSSGRARALPFFSLFLVSSSFVSANVWIYPSVFSLKIKKHWNCVINPGILSWLTPVNLLTLRMLFLEKGPNCWERSDVNKEGRKKRKPFKRLDFCRETFKVVWLVGNNCPCSSCFVVTLLWMIC